MAEQAVKIRVYEDDTEFWMSSGQRSWVMRCDHHETILTTGDFELAYEAALGHACMRHPA